MINVSDSHLIQTKYGYWTYELKPSMYQLSDYYAKKYYQNESGSYKLQYSDEELKYFRLKASLLFRQVARMRDEKCRSLLDVGCGEGWLLDKFYQEKAAVRGIDFSSFALLKFHPHLKSYFEQGNVYDLLAKDINLGNTYDIIVLVNVIEHVTDPVDLLDRLKRLLVKKGILVIVAPNDFSDLHEYLLKEKLIDHPFWLAFPDHLSYFNKISMENLLNDLGFNMEFVLADNPIDLNLINFNSNYINDRSKGKETHYFRVRTDNFLANISEDKLLDLYAILGSMGVGRDLNYYCSLKT